MQPWLPTTKTTSLGLSSKERGMNMKKNYMAPEAEFLGLMTEDILALSSEPQEPSYEHDNEHGSEIVL